MRQGPWPWWFLPAAAAVAVLAAVGHGLVQDWSTGAYVGLAVVIAAAPGALATAVFAPALIARRRGAAVGIRLLDRSALADAAAVDTLLLDGLDTLVNGRHVASVDPLEESNLRNLRWFAGALEHTSDHPIGHAIARLAARGNVTGVEHHPGLGISGSVDRHPVRVGEPAWIGMPTTADGPGITVAVEVDARPLGTITVVDTVRPDAEDAVATLSDLGVTTVLVSSSPGARARAVADQVGVNEVVDGGLNATVEARGPGVAALTTGPMPPGARLTIGPCSNQLQTDDCGIATGAAAVQLCRDTVRVTRLGVRFALGFHTVLITLAATGLLSVWIIAVCAVGGVGLAWLIALYGLRRSRSPVEG